MDRPLFTQVKDAVVASISAGDVPVGAVLPPIEVWAKRTGSSTETVRRVLTELAREGVVQRIRRRGTVVRRRPLAGDACVLLSDEPHANLLFQDAIAAALRDARYAVSMVPTAGLDGATIARLIADQRAAGRDCVIAITPTEKPGAEAAPVLSALAEFPRAVAISTGGRLPMATVSPDFRAGAKQVMEHLVGLGHRRIAVWWVGNDPECEVQAAYCADLLQFAGGSIVRDAPGSRREEFLARWQADGVTAYWSIIDHDALLMANACHRRGIAVPGDFSLVGRNDTPWCAECDPPLTTVSLDPPAVAAAAVGVLERLRAGTAKRDELVLVPPRLVVRGSTGPVKRR